MLGGRILSDARHITSLDATSDAIVELIRGTLRTSGVVPRDIAYINAHGTGTQQNDVLESRGIRTAFGRAADSVCVSATKSMLGHLVNASGSVELAIMALALRDGFAPPTLNLTHPDPDCDLDCIPLVGRIRPLEHALKLSIAFGGHLAAAVLRRWTGAKARQASAAVPSSGVGERRKIANCVARPASPQSGGCGRHRRGSLRAACVRQIRASTFP